jgi:VanZ family protein
MVLFTLWVITLWFLSSHSIAAPEEAPEILHFDKIAHFGYFFGGGYILATWSQLKYDDPSSVFTRYLFPIIFFSIFGAIDEYHQTFTPGRSGNDLYDWIADFLGASFGVFLANYFHWILHKFSSPIAPEPEV